MKSILVVNAKGGVGKTTISTNLAGYYASQKKRVNLVEMDPQCSALEWLKRRPQSLNRIVGINAVDKPLNLLRNCEYTVIDAPAGLHGAKLTKLLRKSDFVLIPVLPSPFDIQALGKYISEFRKASVASRSRLTLGVIANRMRLNTNISLELHNYLANMPCRYLTALRDTTNYITAANSGRSIFEFLPAQTSIDRKDWRPILKWIG